MKHQRIHNFNPGPAALPLSVLEEIQASFLNYAGTGMSITEISHRSKAFDDIINDAVQRTRRLLNLGTDYHVLFLQGGASLQFSMVPMNFLADGRPADYINTGSWSSKAIKEARILNRSIRVIASSEDRDFSYIPGGIQVGEDAAYVHLTSNNTIKGTQWSVFPEAGDIPLIADMSSDIMSRSLDTTPFGLIYAGAQKNIGPAGVCMVIVRKDMLTRVPDDLPSTLKYTTYTASNSLYNTPPCFAVYMVQQVLKWLEETIGGLDQMERINREKADRLYRIIDQSDFYRGTADKESRSMMNVTFRLPNEELEKSFLQKALENNIGGLKGHRSVGGCRASLYNAITLETVDVLVDFMRTFEKDCG
jgi:phosphoserine aminotransferase